MRFTINIHTTTDTEFKAERLYAAHGHFNAIDLGDQCNLFGNDETLIKLYAELSRFLHNDRKVIVSNGFTVVQK